MTVVNVQEHVGGTSETLTATYYVYDDGDPPAAVSRSAATSNATAQFVTDMGFAGTDYTDEQMSDHSWRVHVQWTPSELSNLTPLATGSAQYHFQYRAEAEDVHFGETLEAKGTGAALSDWAGQMNMRSVNNAHSHVSDPTRIPAGPITDRVVYQYSPPIIPSAYRATVQALMGKSNASAYLDWPAECLRLVEVIASNRNDDDQTISFGFAGREERDRTFGGITFTDVPGWQNTWAFTETKIDPTDPFEGTIEVVRAYRSRVVRTGDFSLLALPTV